MYMINNVFIHTYVNICKPYMNVFRHTEIIQNNTKVSILGKYFATISCPSCNKWHQRPKHPTLLIRDVEGPGHVVLAGRNNYESPPENPPSPMVVLKQICI